jgi:hypothetical protein
MEARVQHDVLMVEDSKAGHYLGIMSAKKQLILPLTDQ